MDESWGVHQDINPKIPMEQLRNMFLDGPKFALFLVVKLHLFAFKSYGNKGEMHTSREVLHTSGGDSPYSKQKEFNLEPFGPRPKSA